MSEILEVINAESLVRAEYERLYPGEHPSDEQLARAARAVAAAVSASIGDAGCQADADVEVRLHELGFTGVFVRAPRELIEQLGLCEMINRVNNYLAWEFDDRMANYRAGRPPRDPAEYGPT